MIVLHLVDKFSEFYRTRLPCDAARFGKNLLTLLKNATRIFIYHHKLKTEFTRMVTWFYPEPADTSVSYLLNLHLMSASHVFSISLKFSCCSLYASYIFRPSLPRAIKSQIVRNKHGAEKRDEKLSYSLGARVKAIFAEVCSC